MSLLTDALVNLDSQYWLTLEVRRRIETETLKADPLAMHHVAVASFERVWPKWTSVWPDRKQPADLVRWSGDYIAGKIDKHTMRVHMGRVVTLGDDLQGPTEWEPRVAWVAAAVTRVALHGTGVPKYGETDVEVDMEDLDAAALAACVAGNAPFWEPNPQHAAFWKWWLTGPVPEAVEKLQRD